MERFLVVLFALCVVPSIATAYVLSEPLVLRGYMYCDTCKCGFETSVSKPLDGAAKILCKKRSDPTQVTFTKEFVTGSDGKYELSIYGDSGDAFCDILVVNSTDSGCSKPSSGRDRARVILTRNNGLASNDRFANAIAFEREIPLDNCAQILQQYQETED